MDERGWKNMETYKRREKHGSEINKDQKINDLLFFVFSD